MSKTVSKKTTEHPQEHVLNVITIRPVSDNNADTHLSSAAPSIVDEFIGLDMQQLTLGDEGKIDDNDQSLMFERDNEEDIISERSSTVRFEPISGASETVSTSEKALDRYPCMDNPMFHKMTLQNPRNRTITPSNRRSRNSKLLVQPAKGRSSFHHRFTIEALSQMSKHSAAGDNSDDDDEEEGSGSRDRTVKEGTRGTSVKFQRRGRSLFRSTVHKRSRARSPGARYGCNKKIEGVRRESLSPQVGRRKRHWVRKVMTRCEREKK